MRFFAFFLIFLCAPALAFADPCEGALPWRAGETFRGQVSYTGDGDSLCVGASSDPSTWIEVRLADFDAREIHAQGQNRVRVLRKSRLVRASNTGEARSA
jgi:hypothetical protein